LLTTDVGDLTSPTPLLLDTHVWLWHVEGVAAELSGPLRTAIERAAIDGRALVSAISIWEMAMLEQRGTITLSTELHAWVAASRIAPGVRIAPLSLATLVDGPRLPRWLKRGTNALHKDPADRWIVATARQRAAILVTRDDEMLHYAAQGHVRAFDARP
jgi:PIN domain nuclease of toxin-antitoxin system